MTTETWFISDTHFGHKNILEYEPDARPFKTIEEMNDALVDKWNSVVGEKDIVYHLGDVAFGRHNVSIIGRCNGRKRLVLGNHDSYPSALYLGFFEKIYGCVFYHQCVLSHIPVHPNGLGSRWLLNIHGHLHSKIVLSNEIVAPDEKYPMNWELVPDKHYFNVSCEQNNLVPIHWDAIATRLKEIKNELHN